MVDSKINKWKKYGTLIGSFLMFLPNGVTWYWGNVVVYTDSYFRANLGPHSGFGTPWLISFNVIMWTLGMQLSSVVSKRLGRPKTRILGALIFDVGAFLSYWSSQNSVMLLNWTMGGMTGFSTGFTYGQVLLVLVEWCGDNIGIVSGMVGSAFSAGTLLINAFATHFINPENAYPSVVLGPRKYFTNDKILDKVPLFFLLLGSCSICLHIVALFLIKDKPKAAVDVEKASTDPAKLTTSPFSSSESESSGEFEPLLRIKSKSSDNVFDIHVKKGATLMSEDLKIKVETTDKIVKTVASRIHKQRINSWPLDKDFTPREMVKTCVFYTLWICMFCGDTSYLIVSNYYKTFGQVWIKDDHILTNVGMSVAIGVTVSRVSWGLLIDKVGSKPTLVIFCSSLSIISAFWFFSPEGGILLYWVVTTLLGGLSSCIYVSASVAVLKVFGEAHFTTNFGIVMTSTVVLNIVAPPVLEWILNYYGWFKLFFTVGSLNAVGLMLIVATFPNL